MRHHDEICAKNAPEKVAIDHSTGRSIKMEARTQRVQTWTQNLPDTQKEAKRESERGHKEAIFALPRRVACGAGAATKEHFYPSDDRLSS